jgi:hypothetical protein
MKHKTVSPELRVPNFPSGARGPFRSVSLRSRGLSYGWMRYLVKKACGKITCCKPYSSFDIMRYEIKNVLIYLDTDLC